MASTAESEARRRAAIAPWGPRKPIRMARELATRAHDLPPAETVRLIHALTMPTDETPSGDAA